MDIFIGIDTSCYTTSVAAVNSDGKLLADKRKVLDVKSGERGLQQSEAVFQHVQNLPILMSELVNSIDVNQVQGIAASTRPRPLAGSYMPVFTAGMGQGQIAAKLLGCQFGPASHQEGHLVAGLWSAGGPSEGEFLAVHLSGGTTELLQVTRMVSENSGSLFEIKLLGGTTDLHAGQFVDRVGVRLGLPFPAGPHLEILAREGESGKGLIPSSVQGYEVSFSGPESHAQRLIERGTAPAMVARAVEACIAKTLVKLISKGVKEYGLMEVLVVGGVAANTYIRTGLTEQLRALGVRMYFAGPQYSSDNAVGTALIAAGWLNRKRQKRVNLARVL